eukprot:gnl/TRDRNA2_/TRDRNA2_182778_c0_seq1.p1 gnl/TRDRNA2_/TRDRNA2_182778_c0~~gnl/TRDRNA2_/TRDRNA2_182778_c0_seq1.p1  ORF type:complete len:252 (-),score=76.79 gnl/TRDRNA2_/TRDRNA2_182778_c0_seq1:58-813(-)
MLSMAAFGPMFSLAMLAAVVMPTASSRSPLKAVALNKKSKSSVMLTGSHGSAVLNSTTIQLMKDIEEAENAIKAANAERAKKQKEYDTNADQLLSLIAPLDDAISAVSSSSIQLESVTQAVRKALLAAEPLGFDDVPSIKALAVYLQHTEPEVALRDFDFEYSRSRIVYLLESLQESVKEEKAAVEDAEAKSVADHRTFVQEKTDLMKYKSQQLAPTSSTEDKRLTDIVLPGDSSTAMVPDDQTCLQRCEL